MGPGIADAVKEQLFTPFFTTKSEGMGLGLSLCRTVVEQHGGFLGFEPNRPQGTIFRFTLPVDPATCNLALNATVYIVDDDASVREALAWLLRSRHLLSESYPGGEEFDAMLAGGFSPEQPCCLLLDVRMPGVSGLALFDKLVSAWAGGSDAGDLPDRPCRRADRGRYGQARRFRLLREAVFRQCPG